MNAFGSSRLGLFAVLTALGAAPAAAGDWGDRPSLTVHVGDYRPGYVNGHYTTETYGRSPVPLGRGEYRGGDIDARQERQRGRIWQGWQSGELTRREMRELMSEQRAIANKERYYLADGHLNPYEYADLQSDLDSASRRIYHAQHDDDGRGRRHWREAY